VARATAREKVERDALIVSARAAGFGWARIAQRHGLSERQCRAIWTERLDERLAEPVDWQLNYVELLEQLDGLGDAFALAAEEATHAAAKVGALRGLLTVLERRMEIQRLGGDLPATPKEFFNDSDMRWLNDRIFETFHKFGVPREAIIEIRDLCRLERNGR
jgi:hypothetical protein